MKKKSEHRVAWRYPGVSKCKRCGHLTKIDYAGPRGGRCQVWLVNGHWVREAPPCSPTIDLMAALRSSLAQNGKR